ncbi:hypothetical protein Glaag_3216 [Glaciecola sp. 4H-3-7+YE-5]|nr:hypothetical protein Glaag_3216 [Glaciecola sp. 4H-3-7+YE-5]
MDTNEDGYVSFNGTLAIGPLVGLPSSDWVGNDVADFLIKNNVAVTKFSSFEENISADYIIIVKIMPSLKWLLKHVENGVKILYAPVDIFHSTYVFWEYRQRLKLFSGFLVHNDRVGEILARTSKSPQFFIEHYLKYQINTAEQPDKVNELLWVGHLEYVPSLLKLFQTDKPQLPIRALTDLEKLPHYENYLKESFHQLGYKYEVHRNEVGDIHISGIHLEQWSAKKQEELMKTCIAAFDTKMDSFAHNLKPPTKAQKYIYNKIPFACSEYSFSYMYFEQRGLNVARLDEIEYLTSVKYREQVNEFCNSQKWRVTIESVAQSYIDACLNVEALGSVSKTFCYIRESTFFMVYFILRVINKLKKSFKLKSVKG